MHFKVLLQQNVMIKMYVPTRTLFLHDELLVFLSSGSDLSGVPDVCVFNA
jgi:hypothetical protein